MGEVRVLPLVRLERAHSDGGKGRLLCRRGTRRRTDDLVMDDVDTGIPSDSAYIAPGGDFA